MTNRERVQFSVSRDTLITVEELLKMKLMADVTEATINRIRGYIAAYHAAKDLDNDNCC